MEPSQETPKLKSAAGGEVGKKMREGGGWRGWRRMMEAEESGRKVYEYEGLDCNSVLPTSEKQWEGLEKRWS
jgi:hypothetical protein